MNGSPLPVNVEMMREFARAYERDDLVASLLHAIEERMAPGESWTATLDDCFGGIGVPIQGREQARRYLLDSVEDAALIERLAASGYMEGLGREGVEIRKKLEGYRDDYVIPEALHENGYSAEDVALAREIMREWPLAVYEADYGDYMRLEDVKNCLRKIPHDLLISDSSTGNMVFNPEAYRRARQVPALSDEKALMQSASKELRDVPRDTGRSKGRDVTGR